MTTCAVITWQRGAPSHTLGTIMHGEMAAWSCAHTSVCVQALCQGRVSGPSAVWPSASSLWFSGFVLVLYGFVSPPSFKFSTQGQGPQPAPHKPRARLKRF